MTPALPSKPSVESATDFRHRLFLTARLKLTALYVLIIAVIVCGFSLFLYHNSVQNFSDTSDDTFATNETRQHFVESASDELQHTLVLSDLVIILLSAVVSYFLARRTLEPVERSHEAQHEFASHASHELRTPLAIMRNDIEVLLRDSNPSAAQSHSVLTSNLEEIQRMTALVEDLLALARSEKIPARAQDSVNLEDLCKKVLEKMRPLAEQRTLVLTFQSAGSLNARGSEEGLTRALMNILQNAIEHTQRGTISVTLEREKALAVVTITDTGEGIHPDDVPHVFTRFYKGRARTTQEGTGLGLAIVQEIVEQHSGTVSLTSELGKGTTVRIMLPRV